MGVNGFRVFAAGILIASLLSCSQGHCRRKQDVPAPAPTVEAPPEPATKAMADNGKGRVFIFKYDGSLQCGGGKAVPPEIMAKELAGVKVFSMAKKPDGLMHIQVCGSNTGMANVYEIAEADLSKAEKKGFKKWGFE